MATRNIVMKQHFFPQHTTKGKFPNRRLSREVDLTFINNYRRVFCCSNLAVDVTLTNLSEEGNMLT